MRYLSMFSGIEAATVAWEPLGFEPAAFCEIEAFPSAVLAHHYPHVPNLGDVEKANFDGIGPVDLAVFGSPCQSYSVAGKRLGLDDPRGNLALIAGRIIYRKRPRWFTFENVPGLLSSDAGWDFGTILAAFAGYPSGSVFAPPSDGWGNAGVIVQANANSYGLAWRVLDAQYFGVPQRRRRVFVVGYLGDWRRAAAVLLERHSLSGHPAPSRQAGKGSSASVARSLAIRGRDGTPQAELGDELANAILTPNGGRAGVGVGVVLQEWPADIAPTLNAHFGDKMGLENQHALNGAGLFVAHSLRAEGFDASEDGTGRGTPLVPVAFAHQQGGSVDLHMASNMGLTLQKSQTQAVAFTASEQANSYAWERDVYPTLNAQIPNDSSNIQQGIRQGSAVRRLTPRECERLQGFPDDYTAVPYRGKPAADGPRYKALGNSMAVPVMRWIGERIAMVEALQVQREAA